MSESGFFAYNFIFIGAQDGCAVFRIKRFSGFTDNNEHPENPQILKILIQTTTPFSSSK
jgi:hypothetical protein